MIESKRLLVLYGTQTFTAQEIAEKIWRTTKILGFRGPVLGLDDYPISDLIHEEFAIFVCSTAGQGDEPENMKKFWKFLLKKSLPSNSLVKLKFGVLALGDSTYLKYNFVGKKLHKRLIQLGATPLIDVGLCDYQHDLGHDAVIIPWLKKYWSSLQDYFPNLQIDNLDNKFVPRWKVEIMKSSDLVTVPDNSLSKDIYFTTQQKGFAFIPRLFKISNNVRTTEDSHFQDVRLITLDSIEEKLSYQPGDLICIRPRNSKEDINSLFEIFDTHNMDIKPHYKLCVTKFHEDMPVPEFLQEPLTLYAIAEQYWDLKFIPTQYVFALLALVSDDKLERDKCIELSSAEGQEEWLNYCRRPRRTILEVLQDFHKSTSKLTLDIIFELFSCIKPRAFSIASGCYTTDGQTLDILVAVVKYYSKMKSPRLGLASNWLKTLRSGDMIYGWIKNGTFKFPNDKSTPAILIGPGTGLAPFRSYIQDRHHNKMADNSNVILFFGCRYQHKDFHCKEELLKLAEVGVITLESAFSRDQENKIYVQHRISSRNTFLWPLINDRNACIYISGNAKNMPDNVKQALLNDVLMSAGGLPEDESNVYMKKLVDEGRLQIETW